MSKASTETILLGASLLLGGCTIEGWEMRAADSNCAASGGVERLDVIANKVFATCRDGKMVVSKRPQS